MRFWYRINHLFEDLYFPFAILLSGEEFSPMHGLWKAQVLPTPPLEVAPELISFSWEGLRVLLSGLRPEVSRSSQRAKEERGEEESEIPCIKHPTSQAPSPHSGNLDMKRTVSGFAYWNVITHCEDWGMGRNAMGELGRGSHGKACGKANFSEALDSRWGLFVHSF